MKNITDFIKESIILESVGDMLVKNLENVYKFITSSKFKKFAIDFYGDDLEDEMLDEVYDSLIDALVHINSRAISAAENTEARNDKEFWKAFQDAWVADPDMMWEGADVWDEQACSMAGVLYADVYKQVTHKTIDFEIKF